MFYYTDVPDKINRFHRVHKILTSLEASVIKVFHMLKKDMCKAIMNGQQYIYLSIFISFAINALQV